MAFLKYFAATASGVCLAAGAPIMGILWAGAAIAHHVADKAVVSKNDLSFENNPNLVRLMCLHQMRQGNAVQAIAVAEAYKVKFNGNEAVDAIAAGQRRQK